MFHDMPFLCALPCGLTLSGLACCGLIVYVTFHRYVTWGGIFRILQSLFLPIYKELLLSHLTNQQKITDPFHGQSAQHSGLCGTFRRRRFSKRKIAKRSQNTAF